MIRFKFSGLIVASLALMGGGCGPADGSNAAIAPSSYVIHKAAGDDERAVYYIRDQTTRKVYVMAWSRGRSGGTWVKIDEFAPVGKDGHP